MSLSHAIQSLLPRPDRRSDQEIENELEAEIAFHLEQATRDVMLDDHLSPDEARSVALRRFGDVEAIKKRCRRIALEERIMLKKIHVALTVLLALGLVVTIFVAVQAVARAKAIAIEHRMVAEMARQEAMTARQQVTNEPDRARADALYDFVKTLMVEVGPERAGDHAHIRAVLDTMEAGLPTKYPDNPDLQGLIREMIAGRRKILEFDEQPVHAGAQNDQTMIQATQNRALQEQLHAEQQKVQALQRFVQEILSKADPNSPPPVSVKELLDLASKQMGASVGIDPESRETLQRVLDDAINSMQHAQTQPATQSSDE